jgi:hypothetical protein
MTQAPRRAHLDLLPPVVEPESGLPSATPNALTPTDRGRLPESSRRALVKLVQGPYLMRDAHPNLWPALLADEDAIREHLGDLFLDLVLDIEAGLAFVRAMTAPDRDLPKTIRSIPMTFIDTALLLHLRELLLRADAGAPRVFVGRDEIDEHLAAYRAEENTDHVTYGRRINASVEKLKKASVLLMTKEEDRYEISPVLAMVFDADTVIAVTAELRRLAAGGTATAVATESEGEDSW